MMTGVVPVVSGTTSTAGSKLHCINSHCRLEHLNLLCNQVVVLSPELHGNCVKTVEANTELSTRSISRRDYKV